MLKKSISLFIFSLCLAIIVPTSTNAIEFDENYNPNKIVSDFQMYNNTNSMSEQQIQQFLQSKDSYLSTYVVSDAEGINRTAAQIIYNAAQTYQINPQAIIVLLQKEQGLIQKENPSQKRLDWATGYAVCDGCYLDDPKVLKYKGFGKQVDNGAGAMRFYKESMNKYNFIKKVGQAYTISDETVIPENYATAALYTYTPHLFGNYNFWRIWQRYFGNPLAESPLDVQATVQTKYMSQIVDSASPNIKSLEGEKAWYWVEFLNIGTETWNNQDLKSLYLIDANATNQIPLITEDSSFNESLDSFTKIYATKTEIKPGEVLRVSIPIEANYNKKESSNYVLALDKKGWLPGTQVNYEITRQFRYDAELIEDNMPEFSEENTRHDLIIQYKNVGLKTWYSKDIYLNWFDKTKNFQVKISMEEASVAPGKIATFKLFTKIKDTNTYNYEIGLLKKVSTTKYNGFPTGDVNKTITVSSGLAARIIDFQVPEAMKPGQEYYARILLENIGGSTWTPNKLVLRSYSKLAPYTRSKFYSPSWVSGFAIDKVRTEVKPGQTYTFFFKIKAPNTSALYNQYYQLEWGDNYTEIKIDNDYSKLVKTKVSNSLSAAQQ